MFYLVIILLTIAFVSWQYDTKSEDWDEFDD